MPRNGSIRLLPVRLRRGPGVQAAQINGNTHPMTIASTRMPRSAGLHSSGRPLNGEAQS